MDSDDEFLLPDNSNKGNNKNTPPPTAFNATPTPLSSSDPVPVGFPVQNNSDYASGLLAARRRGLQQSTGSGNRVSSNSPPVRRSSPTATTGSTPAATSGPGLASSSGNPSFATTIGSAAASANFTSSSQPIATDAADEALFRALNPLPMAPPIKKDASPPIPQPAAVPSHTVAAAPAEVVPVAASVAPPQRVIDADRIEKLRAELETKKRTLSQVREREQALMEKIRAEKAKKAAELQVLEANVKRQWEDVEKEKLRLEAEYRRTEEEQEEFLRRERARVEAEETAAHQPAIEALQNQHRALQQEELTLRQALSAATANKDVVTLAVSSAVSEVMKRVKSLFAEGDENGGATTTTTGGDGGSALPDLKEWEDSIRAMVRREVKTAFTSSVSSAAESERAEFSKSFEEMLRFWKDAEEEEQHQITKMDEQLMLDLQSMAHEGLERLQREENTIEELFMASREQWTIHHREILHKELDAAVARRTKEIDAQRALRTELHNKKLRDIEHLYKEQLDNAKKAHDQRLELLKKEQQMLERVHDAKNTMITRVRDEAHAAMQNVNASVDSMSEVLTRMDELKRALDDMRSGLDKDRQRSLELREATLSDVQGLIVSQATAVEHERNALSTALVKLDVTHAAMERQLEQERLWTAESQNKIERSQQTWEREYRRWQHAVAQEKRQAEQRFSDVLLQLQEAATQLEEESRQIDVDGNTMRRACAARSASIAAELSAVEKKEEDLSSRHQQLLILLAELESKSQKLSSEWQRVLSERQALATQRAELEREEMKLGQMADQLEFMKQQVDQTHLDAREASLRGRSMAQQLDASRDAAREGLERVRRHAERTMPIPTSENDGRGKPNVGLQQQQQQQRQNSAAWRMSNPNRFPLKVLAELRESLTAGGQQAVAVAQEAHHDESRHRRHADPTMRVSEAYAGDHQDEDDDMAHTAGGASSYHFTNLVGVSDAETTSLSQQTSS